MILAEDVLLLLTDDVTGKALVDPTRLELGLAGALLLDLAEAGRIDVAGPGEAVKKGRLVVRRADPVGDAVLDEALRRLASSSPKKPQNSLGMLRSGLRDSLYGRLAARGIVRAEQGKILGIFPTRVWPATDSRHEEAVRTGLRDAIVVGRTPTPREAALIALLAAVDGLPQALGDVGLSKRELRARAKAVSQSGFAHEAVRKAIEAVNAAIVGAVTASIAAGAATG